MNHTLVARSAGSAETQRGFTLIELLVVVAIIGMLSTVVLASLNGARAKARDARRLSDAKQIQLALELYYGDHNQYPVDAGYISGPAPTADALISALAPAYMPFIPDDPLGVTGGSNYYYYTNTSSNNHKRGYSVRVYLEGYGDYCLFTEGGVKGSMTYKDCRSDLTSDSNPAG